MSARLAPPAAATLQRSALRGRCCVPCELAERGDAILSGRLRRVERLIAGPEESRGRCSVERVRRDTRRDPEREACLREPLGEQRSDLGAERFGRFGPRTREHHDELVATETGRLGTFRDRARQDVGDLLQQGVAELVTGPVVDLLEVVAVDHEQAQRTALRVGRGKPAVQQLLEPAPVEQAGQRVGHRAVPLSL